MNNILQPGGDHDGLSKILQTWKVAAPLPPRFEEQVWQRIARVGAAPNLWLQFLNWLELALPRRAVAGAYLAILLLAGLTAGYWESRSKANELDEILGRRYVQMIDPFQARER